jgi:hypothetical protein
VRVKKKFIFVADLTIISNVMRNIIVIFALFWGAILYVGCTKCGCTDPDAINYDESAKKDDGSCAYPVDPRSKIVGKYICSRKSEQENTTDENIVLEIFPVRTSEKLLSAWDSSLNLTFLMTYDNKGNLCDTALAQGLPGYTQLFTGYGGSIKNYETSVSGTYDKSKSILLNYNCHKCTGYDTYTPEHYVYTGTRIQEYPVTFDTPDYRGQWTGIYEGTKCKSMTTGPAGLQHTNETTTNVTLEVSLADNDSVVRIEEIIDNPEAMFYYAEPDGTLKRIGNVGSFSNDSLIIEIGQTYSPGSSGSTSYKCKKR